MRKLKITTALRASAVLMALLVGACDEEETNQSEKFPLFGLKREEIAGVVGVSVPTVDRELRFARAWLKQKLAA